MLPGSRVELTNEMFNSKRRFMHSHYISIRIFNIILSESIISKINLYRKNKLTS